MQEREDLRIMSNKNTESYVRIWFMDACSYPFALKLINKNNNRFKYSTMQSTLEIKKKPPHAGWLL